MTPAAAWWGHRLGSLFEGLWFKRWCLGGCHSQNAPLVSVLQLMGKSDERWKQGRGPGAGVGRVAAFILHQNVPLCACPSPPAKSKLLLGKDDVERSVKSFSSGGGRGTRLLCWRLAAKPTGLMAAGQLGWWEACWAPNWFKRSWAESRLLQIFCAWSESELKQVPEGVGRKPEQFLGAEAASLMVCALWRSSVSAN